jgi:hypothetical protein
VARIQETGPRAAPTQICRSVESNTVGQRAENNPRAKQGQNDEQLFLRVMDRLWRCGSNAHTKLSALLNRFEDLYVVAVSSSSTAIISAPREPRTHATANPEEYVRQTSPGTHSYVVGRYVFDRPRSFTTSSQKTCSSKAKPDTGITIQLDSISFFLRVVKSITTKRDTLYIFSKLATLQ